jgi:AcrR family transcriptional regulator
MYQMVHWRGRLAQVSEANSPRQRLLAAVIQHIQHAGVTDLSLRELAAAIGTSHRMLLYHFGSREGLMVAVVHAVEDQQRAFLADLLESNPLASRDEVLRSMWRRLVDKRLWPNERLFFELYVAALQDRPGTAGMLEDIVDAWVRPMVAFAREHAMDVELAEVETRLGVAVVRGLLLDLLATRDRAAVDRAFERYLELLPPV